VGRDLVGWLSRPAGGRLILMVVGVATMLVAANPEHDGRGGTHVTAGTHPARSAKS
jgi:hypothetical protein